MKSLTADPSRRNSGFEQTPKSFPNASRLPFSRSGRQELLQYPAGTVLRSHHQMETLLLGQDFANLPGKRARYVPSPASRSACWEFPRRGGRYPSSRRPRPHPSWRAAVRPYALQQSTHSCRAQEWGCARTPIICTLSRFKSTPTTGNPCLAKQAALTETDVPSPNTLIERVMIPLGRYLRLKNVVLLSRVLCKKLHIFCPITFPDINAGRNLYSCMQRKDTS